MKETNLIAICTNAHTMRKCEKKISKETSIKRGARQLSGIINTSKETCLNQKRHIKETNFKSVWIKRDI